MKKFTKFVALIAATGALFASCTSDVEDSIVYDAPPTVSAGESAYVLATKVGDYYYYLTAEDLKSGNVTVVGNGTMGNSITEYAIVDNDYLYTVADGGGSNPAPVYAYYLDASTSRIAVDMTKYYSTVKYEAWGQVDGNFVHLAPITHTVDETAYEVSALDYANRTTNSNGVVNSSSLAGSYQPYYIGYSFSDTRLSQYVAADNFLGTGETVTFSGFAEAGDYVYVSVVPMYTLPWAVNEYRSKLETLLKEVTNDQNADLDEYIAYGYGSQVSLTASNNTLTTWSNAFTPTSGIPYPISVDRCYVAVYNKGVRDFATTTPVEIIETDKMGAALMRRVRNPRPAMVTGANGDVYVFASGGLRKTDDEFKQYYTSTTTTDAAGTSTTAYSDEIADLKVIKGEKGGSVMRIKSGERAFDTSFGTDGVVDIESLIKNVYGHYAFTRVFHAGNNKFILRIMDEPYSISGGTYTGCYNTMHKSLYDTRFAVLDLSGATPTLSKITGMPEGDEINSGSASAAIHDPYCEDGVAYIPVALASGGARVYYVDTNNTSVYGAEAGLFVNTDYLMGLGKLTAQ